MPGSQQTGFQWEEKIAQVVLEKFPPGTLVYAPYRDPPVDQPWLHGRHRGRVLEPDLPKVWANSLAFPTPRPNREQVRAWLREIQARGLLLDKVPVAWSFGKIYWERIDTLRLWVPYATSKTH